MSSSRRQFLRVALIGTAGTTLASGCSWFELLLEDLANRPMRRDIDSLTPDDPIVLAYKSAVTQMKALPASDKRSWSYQASIHDDHCPHGNWLFLPWHRWYLFRFEQICRNLSGMTDFALPYWNWTKQPKIPAVFWGGASNPLYDGTRTIGPEDSIDSAFVGSCVVDKILDDPNFETFASSAIGAADDQRKRAIYGQLEATPHNHVHATIAGNMGSFLSPLDPIFWLHHNMVERCWVEWNLVRGHPNTNDHAWLDRAFTEFVDVDGNPTNDDVAKGLFLPVLAYQYDELSTTGPCVRAVGAERGARLAEGWRALSRVDSRAAREALLERAKSGAKTRLDVQARSAVRPDRSWPMDGPARVRLPLAAAGRPSAAVAGERFLLRFRGVSLDHTGDFAVRVFVNQPEASASTSADDPHYAGGFSFFGHSHGGGSPSERGDFVLDVTPTIQRLGAEPDSVELSVVLVPFDKRQPKTRELAVTEVELQRVRDVVESSLPR